MEGRPGPLEPRRRGGPPSTGLRGRQKDTSDHPYVENYPALRTWLDDRDARCMWQVGMQCEHDRRGEPPTAFVECWGFPAPHPTDPDSSSLKLAIIVVHARRLGWEIYTDCDSNQISTTFEDAERRLGLQPSTQDGPVGLLREVLSVLMTGGDFQLGPEGRHATLIKKIKGAIG